MRMWTVIERDYWIRPDGLYQEIENHFLIQEKPDGTKVREHDKSFYGRILAVDDTGMSGYGVVEHDFADGIKRRLVARSNRLGFAVDWKRIGTGQRPK